MPEYRNLFYLPAVRLAREDVECLANLITDGFPSESRSTALNGFKFSLGSGDRTYRANSIDDLLAQKLPPSIDSLVFEAVGWTDDNEIDRGVSINLQPSFAHCQIHALEEVWFKGKTSQLREFFRERSPWYGKLRKFLLPLSGVVDGAALVAMPYFYFRDQYLFTLIAGLTLVANIKVTFSHLNGRLLPHTDIQLTEKPSLITRDNLTLAVSVVGTIATVVGVVYQLV